MQPRDTHDWRITQKTLAAQRVTAFILMMSLIRWPIIMLITIARMSCQSCCANVAGSCRKTISFFLKRPFIGAQNPFR